MSDLFPSACAQRALDASMVGHLFVSETTVGQHHIVLAHVFELLELEALLQCESVSSTWHDVVSEHEEYFFGQLLVRMPEYDRSSLVHLRHLTGDRARPGFRWDV